MPLTFLQAKSALDSRAPSGKIEFYINRALERLLAVGGIKGLTEKLTFTVHSTEVDGVPAETLVLPAKYSTILGCIIRGTQTGVAAEWYAELPGVPIDDAGLPTHPITDLGIVQNSGLRHYHVPVFEGDTSVTVTARCRIQHVEISSNSAVLPISNLSALGLALDAIVYEMAGDFDNSQKYFSRAVDILREERKESEPDIPAVSPVRIVHSGESLYGATTFY